MKRLIRKAILFAVGALVVAGAANAGAPSSANSSKVIAIQLVTTNGSGGPGPDAVDPKGNFEFRIMDAIPNGINGATVTMGFAGCPHIHLADNAPANRMTTTTVDCIAKTVSAVTATPVAGPHAGQAGWVTIAIVGQVDQTSYITNQNFPEPDPATPPPPVPPCPPNTTPQNYFGCGTVTVTVPGFPAAIYPNVIVAAYDHNGPTGTGVDGGDLSLALADRLSGNYRERSDYDASFNTATCSNSPGYLTGQDLSVALTVRLGGGSTSNIASICP